MCEEETPVGEVLEQRYKIGMQHAGAHSLIAW